VMNSNESFVLDDGIKINVFATANPTIAGRVVGGIRKRHVILEAVDKEKTVYYHS